MKLNGKMLLAVAMMVGSLGAVGCNKSNAQDDAVAPEENAAASPTEDGQGSVDDLSVRFETSVSRPRYYAPYAPPAARYEVRTVAPSANHFWTPGYYRWNGRSHVWYGGRWEARRANYDYMGPRWVASGRRYEYVPGHWVRHW
jgi:hypothetical protein